MLFELPKLPYAYDALMPYIDAATMELHYTKHHQGYVDKLNGAIGNTAYSLKDKSLIELLQGASQFGEAIRNNGGGHYNHRFFWTILSPKGGGEPTGVLADAIIQRFGSFDQFKQEFNTAATTRFGSGWAWLYIDERDELQICSTPNQDNPLMDVVPQAHRGMPILGLDVWEHAYYLHYQNRRPEYIDGFWQLVNWEKVADRYQKAF